MVPCTGEILPFNHTLSNTGWRAATGSHTRQRIPYLLRRSCIYWEIFIFFSIMFCVFPNSYHGVYYYKIIINLKKPITTSDIKIHLVYLLLNMAMS